MTIQEYMKRTERITPSDILCDMPSLFAASLSKGAFPPPVPMPGNLNAASLSRAGVLNGQRLELYALSLGFDRALWLPAADAAFLGLETSESVSKPLTLISKTRHGASFHTSAQTVYLLDQFTSVSLERMLSCANPGFNSAERQGLEGAVLSERNTRALTAVYALSRYDAGLGEEELRKQARKNLRDNSRPGTPGFTAASETYKKYTSSLSTDAKQVFDFLRVYYTQQLSGASLIDASHVDKPALVQSMKTLSGSREDVITTFFYANDFAGRLVSPSFSIDYSRSIPAPAVLKPIPKPVPAYTFREGR